MACSNCNGNHPEFPPELYGQLDIYIDALKIEKHNPRRKGTLIQTLHTAQHIFGYLPAELQKLIARKYNISHAEVSGVISFYNYFTTLPKGDVQINVCMGTACYVNGAEKVLQEFERVLGIRSGQVTEDGKFSLDSLRCVGACGLAPVVTFNSKVYGKVQPASVKAILEDYLVESGQEAEEPVYA